MNFLERIEKIIQEFTKKQISLSLAESCTGGYISHMITNISGSSKVFERGIISYSNQAKIELLNVNPRDIKKFGAVSEQVAEQMAENIRIQSKVDIGIGITGIAGPTGATPSKPLGLVYIGFSTKENTFVKESIFNTDRILFKDKVLNEVLIYLEAYF
ncbi:MAG: CinA family protein [Promethearchaeota archaeon]